MIEFIKIIIIVAGIQWLLKTSTGKKFASFLPTPFWIYFLPMVFSTIGLLEPRAIFHSNQALVYDSIAKHFLPAALVLMLIGSPMGDFFRLGGKATLAMILGTITVTIGTFISFIILAHTLPIDSYKAAGALLATWTGGSANMLAVKEALRIPEYSMAPLVITDTLLSYSWMAILVVGVNFQHFFIREELSTETLSNDKYDTKSSSTISVANLLTLFMITFIISESMVLMGGLADLYFGFLNSRAWTLVFISAFVVLLAMTPLKKLENWGASSWGTFFLYLVLAGIGARTSLKSISDAPVFILYGILVFIIHGILMIGLGKLFRIPLSLLATSSQANIGGPVSAPIVASLYQPGTAQFGVLMGIFGNIIGTYVGLFGAWVCQHLKL